MNPTAAGLATCCALCVAAVLARAGEAKLRRRAATETAFSAMGIPSSRLMSWLVPAIEVAVAVCLVAAPWLGGILAAGLLAAFTVLLPAWSFPDGTLRCPCFGKPEQVQPFAVAVLRNASLLAAAVVSTATPRLAIPTLADLSIFSASAGAVAGILGFLKDRGRVSVRTLDRDRPGNQAETSF
jgi:uncharacterized membrane protein YphA (DoxX/SURF4 family)